MPRGIKEFMTGKLMRKGKYYWYSWSLMLVLSFSFTAVFGQDKLTPKTMKGLVIDAATYLPVEGAVITCIGGKQTVTNKQGEFNMQQGDSIRVSAIGYAKKAIGYSAFEKNNKTIFLEQSVVQLNTVIVGQHAHDPYRSIGKLDIQLRDVSNSQEVLRLVPGLFIGQHAGGGKAEQIFLRGFDIDHGTDVHISVDGMPVNMVSHAHGQGYADLHFLIPELIENVAFGKGPYYAEKGNLATAGFVGFRTRNVLPQNIIKLEAGQFNTWRGAGMMNVLSGNARKKNQSAIIGSEYMYTKGYFDNPQNFRRWNVFGKYYGKISRSNDLSISASMFSSKWKASGQIPERALQSGLIGYFGAIDPNEGGITGRANVNAQLQTSLGNGNYVKNQVYYTNYDFELYSNFTFFLNNNRDGDQVRQKEKRNMIGYNGSYSHTGYAGDKKITTDAGVSVRFDKTHNSELSRTKDRAIIIEPLKLGDIKELNAGVWINETIRWNERFSINGGLRYDHFDVSYLDKLQNNSLRKANAGILSPKLNFYYQLNNNTQLYLTMGKGFHSNDARVVVETGGRQILPAAYGADLGIVLKPAKDLLLQSALWFLKLDQEFVYVGDEGVVEPGGRTRRIGIDLSARYQPVKWLYIDGDANYSYGRAIDEAKGDDRLPLAPVFTSIGGITWKSGKGIHASLRYRYMGDRPANDDNSIVARGYFVTDAVVNYTRSKFELGIAIQNLFDVRWKETQFDTESKLQNETIPVSEIHFTPGTPFFLKTHVTFFF
jgi:outer membrane receptor protein involved in Fe transport